MCFPDKYIFLCVHTVCTYMHTHTHTLAHTCPHRLCNAHERSCELCIHNQQVLVLICVVVSTPCCASWSSPVCGQQLRKVVFTRGICFVPIFGHIIDVRILILFLSLSLGHQLISSHFRRRYYSNLSIIVTFLLMGCTLCIEVIWCTFMKSML
jgi:hypothetical protein